MITHAWDDADRPTNIFLDGPLHVVAAAVINVGTASAVEVASRSVLGWNTW